MTWCILVVTAKAKSMRKKAKRVPKLTSTDSLKLHFPTLPINFHSLDAWSSSSFSFHFLQFGRWEAMRGPSVSSCNSNRNHFCWMFTLLREASQRGFFFLHPVSLRLAPFAVVLMHSRSHNSWLAMASSSIGRMPSLGSTEINSITAVTVLITVSGSIFFLSFSWFMCLVHETKALSVYHGKRIGQKRKTKLYISFSFISSFIEITRR